MGEACKMMCPWASSLLSIEVLNVISYCSTPRQLQCSAKLWNISYIEVVCKSSPHFVQHRTWTDDIMTVHRATDECVARSLCAAACTLVCGSQHDCESVILGTVSPKRLKVFTCSQNRHLRFICSTRHQFWQITCAFANAHRHHYIRVLHTLPETLTFICIYILALWFCI